MQVRKMSTVNNMGVLWTMSTLCKTNYNNVVYVRPIIALQGFDKSCCSLSSKTSPVLTTGAAEHRKLLPWQKRKQKHLQSSVFVNASAKNTNLDIPDENNDSIPASSTIPDDATALRAALVAAEKSRRDALEAAAIAEAKSQEYATIMKQTTEEAMTEIEASKQIFKIELEKMLEEKLAVQFDLAVAKQDAITLAVNVEKIAEMAIHEATARLAEDLQCRLSAAETAVADVTLKVQEKIRCATEDAVASIVKDAKSAIDEALAVAGIAKDQASQAEVALAKPVEAFSDMVHKEAAVLSLQEDLLCLELKLKASEGEAKRLCLELESANEKLKSADVRIAAAEATISTIQEIADKAKLERSKSTKDAIELIKCTVVSGQEAARMALQADFEALKAAYAAVEKAGNVKEQANLRRFEALERSLTAAEKAASAWKNRARAVESLLQMVKDEGLESAQIGRADEKVFGGRMENMLGNDSRKWDLLAKGPRREMPDWMKRRIEIGVQSLPPQNLLSVNLPIEADVPLSLPTADNVWSISSAKGKEDDLFTKHAVEKEALDEQRRALERALQKKAGKKLVKEPEERDGKLESGTGSGREIVFQGFNWESCRRKWYLELLPKAADLAKCGITTIWLPPPTNSVAPQGYMPGDLYNLNSAYGTQSELKQCIDEMHRFDILVLGDAVLNHRCAQKQSPNGVWNIFGGKLAWGPEAIVSDDPNFQGRGHPSSGDFFHGAPNIDHSQDFVRTGIKEWMKWLRTDLGFDGWRLDFVRGFWGGYVKEYIEATNPVFAIGEYWDSLAYEGGQVCYNQDAHRQRIINWINATGGTSSAFDVTTKGILHSALHNEYWRLIDPQGKPPGVLGWWPSRAVTFLENHDTGSTQGHWPFPRNKLMQGYAYILTHPGTPVIFYDHFYDFGLHDPISELIAARKRTGIHCRSIVKILHATVDGYVGLIGGTLVLKLGHLDWNPSKQNNLDGNWDKSVDKGVDYQLWEKK